MKIYALVYDLSQYSNILGEGARDLIEIFSSLEQYEEYKKKFPYVEKDKNYMLIEKEI